MKSPNAFPPPGLPRQRLLLSAAALALVAGPALAEEAPEADQREETITVYGTSNPLPVFDYPGQVTVISRDTLELIQPSAMSDLLRDVPGVEFSGGPRRTGESPSIRGFGRENVLVLVDGARQSFSSAHDGSFFLDPELLRAAEVVRGPASALYGSGAVGGVLAFETASAADLLREGETFGARLRAGYQSANEEWLGSATVFGTAGNLDALASFGLRQSGDIALGSGVDLPSDDEIQTGLIKLGYQFTDAFSGEIAWQKFTNSAVEPNNGQGTAGTGDATLDRDVDKDITSELWRGALAFNPASDLIDAKLTVYQQKTGVDEFDVTVPRTTLREIETTGISLRNASRFQLGPVETTLTVGGDWYEDSQVGTDSTATGGIRGGVPNGSAEFTGVFVQAEAEVARPFGLPGRLVVIPGIRHDSFESSSELSTEKASDDQISPRLGATYAPVEWLRLYASYAEGFRAPSVNELYLDGVHFSVPHPTLFNPGLGQFVFVSNNFVPNADLKPESSETVELGFGLDFADVLTSNDRFQSKVSYFESDVTDLINLSVDFSYDPTCFTGPSFFPCTAGTTNSANIAGASLEGWEAEASYDAPLWYARAAFSTIAGTDTATGEDLGTLTPDRLSLDAGLKLDPWNTRLGTRLQIADEFERRALSGGVLTVAERRAGYVVVDLYASWRPEFAPNLRIDAGVDNVLDHDYDRVFAGVSEPGRNFKIALSWQFGQ
ncbi:TonB-dependent hemoglobin/transferrin/lactoferrin family receptor [Hyphomonas sp. WL0036]|uniref:TonB-dependent hemoglobin/transferrin/lactoferrin family receptor n=1 Tax=Hyphomonas sediminis TaxID=2866160 RepID=UPI001C7EF2BD|nr:TonB-dependent hemoglobin/transferrin/lactoferrin family receptor [Hyphomonas sediminis]MBY9067211.1 TonB-dependent hemoglobin/transferrin/lactoferrin family receptor [Hyphomonas sediminis]